MTTIKTNDLIDSIADSLQFISYYHSKNFIQSMGQDYLKEQAPAAKDAIAQILVNSRICSEKRPICQDTGIVNAFIKVGMDVRWAGAQSLNNMVNKGVRRAYLSHENKLRASIIANPIGGRCNTGDNTPAIIDTKLYQAIKLR